MSSPLRFPKVMQGCSARNKQISGYSNCQAGVYHLSLYVQVVATTPNHVMSKTPIGVKQSVLGW